MIDILNYGAVNDGKTLCTEAFARAIEACKQNDDTLCVPAGRYLTGTINLDGVSLHLMHGARIIGSENPDDYPPQPYVHNELGVLRALLVSLHGENMVIDGDGVIDLRGSAFFDFERPIVPQTKVPMTAEEIAFCTVRREWRPSQSIFLRHVNGLTIRGIKVVDAPCWTFSIVDCQNVRMVGLDIDTNLNIPNDDGIHICSCDGVIISDCHISSGDDCIALSCITDWDKPCRNIVISNCVLHSCSKAIVIGYQFSHVYNVVVSNVIIRESNRGLCFMCHDEGGLVEHVRVNNMVIDTAIRPGDWWGNGEAVFMEALPSASRVLLEQDPHRKTPINYRDIVLENISCTSENAIGAVGTGHNYEDVTFRGITVTLKEAKYMHLKGRVFDTAPSPENVPIPEDCAVYIKNADVALVNIVARSVCGGEARVICEV